MNPQDASRQGARHLLRHCGGLRPGEAVALICDPTTRRVADLLAEEAAAAGGVVNLVEIPPLGMHGEDPGADAAAAMRAATLAIGVTAKSLAHSTARLEACAAGARYLSLPEFSLDLLADPALTVDYRKAGDKARRVADIFTRGSLVRVSTERGTDVELEIAGRIGNCCPGWVEAPGSLGSPPDIEANVSPIETYSRGVVVVDGSIPYPGFGLLREPVQLSLRDGAITDIVGEPRMVARLDELFNRVDPRKSRVLAECGVGLNPQATLTGVMLTDEGALGTMHFGFGSNATVGGVNDVPFHLDAVFRNPTLMVDDIVILDNGQYVL